MTDADESAWADPDRAVQVEDDNPEALAGEPVEFDEAADDGTSDDGTSDDGTSDDGTSDDGTSDDGGQEDFPPTPASSDAGTANLPAGVDLAADVGPYVEGMRKASDTAEGA